jgi:hypothetical protein
MWQQIKSFFKLPFADKKDIINDPKKGQQRGWSPPGEEKTWWLESNTGDVESPKFSDNKVCLVTSWLQCQDKSTSTARIGNM